MLTLCSKKSGGSSGAYEESGGFLTQRSNYSWPWSGYDEVNSALSDLKPFALRSYSS